VCGLDNHKLFYSAIYPTIRSSHYSLLNNAVFPPHRWYKKAEKLENNENIIRDMVLGT